MRAFISVAIVLTAAVRVAGAQPVPGKNLTVDVRVTSATMRGDTTRIEYVLTNHAQSIERMFQFTVDAPSAAISIAQPQPDTAWITGKVSVGRPVARWAAIAEVMMPGETSPTLAFEAIGLSGLVSAWYRGYTPPSTPPPPTADTIADTLPPPPIVSVLDRSVNVVAVGIDPHPAPTTNTGLLTRLDSLTVRTCTDLSWISSGSVCTSLDESLSETSTALGQSDGTAARAALLDFLTLLESAHSPPTGPATVGENAYWLLKTNATFLRDRISP